MEAEEFLKLFDSCWFERGIVFTSKQNHLPAPAANFAAKQSEESKNIINYDHGLQNLQVRSLSDRCLGVKIFENSVMMQPKLQKILSGIEVVDLSRSEEENGAKLRDKKTCCSKRNIKGSGRKGMMKRSLSALEFEELKGFMDLGFVFTEEDRSSANLVSIIPGLQKWGDQKLMEEKLADHRDYSSRPYLSEAWRRNNKIKRPLINWRIPSQQINEISMKDHLRNWAQTVASTVSR